MSFPADRYVVFLSFCSTSLLLGIVSHMSPMGNTCIVIQIACFSLFRRVVKVFFALNRVNHSAMKDDQPQITADVSFYQLCPALSPEHTHSTKDIRCPFYFVKGVCFNITSYGM